MSNPIRKHKLAIMLPTAFLNPENHCPRFMLNQNSPLNPKVNQVANSALVNPRDH